MEGMPAAVGRYRIRGELGRGAMGVVYRAYDPQLDREVAVKCLHATPPAGRDVDELASRLAREARVAAKLVHPNIVTVHDAGRDGDRIYAVLELVSGESLAARLERGERPALGIALELVAQTADALAYAHRLGVVHRDIKPGNLLVDAGGRVRVTDFGIAKALGETTELTRTGMVVGSPAYLSPEQLQGLPIDGRSDLFSLGVVLYELALGRRPFPADTFTALVFQILHLDPLTAPAAPADLPLPVVALLRDSLAKERGERISDAGGFAVRARALAAELPLAAGGTMAGAPPPPLTVPVAGGGRAAPGAASPRPTDTPAAGSAARPTAWLVAGGAALALAVVALVAGSPRLPEIGAPPPLAAAPPLVRGGPPPAPAGAGDVRPGGRSLPVTPVEPLVAVGARDAAAGAALPPPASVAVATAPSPAPPTDAAPADAPAPEVAAVYRARRAFEFDVAPEEAVVWVDGARLGVADDWDGAGGGGQFVPPAPGRYLVRLELAEHRTAWIALELAADAEDEVVEIDFELEEID